MALACVCEATSTNNDATICWFHEDASKIEIYIIDYFLWWNFNRQLHWFDVTAEVWVSFQNTEIKISDWIKMSNSFQVLEVVKIGDFLKMFKFVKCEFLNYVARWQHRTMQSDFTITWYEWQLEKPGQGGGHALDGFFIARVVHVYAVNFPTYGSGADVVDDLPGGCSYKSGELMHGAGGAGCSGSSASSLLLNQQRQHVCGTPSAAAAASGSMLPSFGFTQEQVR